MLDLTLVPAIPSLFNNRYGAYRSDIAFMHHFRRELSRPILPGNNEHIEYVPTQAIAEYFRVVASDDDVNQVDGIIYPSSQSKTGICIAIFAKQEECAETTSINDNTKLVLIDTATKYVSLPGKYA